MIIFLGMVNMDDICSDVHKLLSKKDVIQLSLNLNVSPADDQTKKYLEEFIETCVATNKHRDTNISASFLYKMIRNGKQVDDLLVFKEGVTVPKYWLSKGGFCSVALFFAIGLPWMGR
jgi:hypothetical protein